MRLTNDSAASHTAFNNAWGIASNGSTVHIVFDDDRIDNDNNYEIYYKRSTDNGLTWSADIRLTNSFGWSKHPSIAISGQTIHIVWWDWRDGYKKIYYKRSTDNGVTWGTDTRIVDLLESFSISPSITVTEENVHVTWVDDRDGNREIYYKHSTDGGLSWGPDTRLTIAEGNSIYPSISVVGQSVHLAWYDYRMAPAAIYYKRSTNNGTDWESEVLLVNSAPHFAWDVCISVNNQNIHIVWADLRNAGDPEIYYKKSSDLGTTWGSDIRLTNDPNLSSYPSIIAVNGNVHVTWMDDRDGNPEIYYKLSTNEGNSWEGDLRLTNNPGGSAGASVSVSGTYVYTAWYDGRDGNTEIYYKCNPTGNPLTGISTINSEIPKKFSLSQNYPNPFNPMTKIQFAISKQSNISLKILDVTGKIVVSVIEDLQMSPGNYEEFFESKSLASGVYFYSLYADDILLETKKMVLLK
ncbi:MAG: T9SS type A sorting domain-containing protein [Ignavibacteria bacterium]|nr:T9SS type A sorting domain-containing protein [Ignavibacteria bacterium]